MAKPGLSRLVELLRGLPELKEGLVEKASEWPGVHCVRALVDGEPIEGTWFDRTQEYAARRRGEDFDRLRYATTEASRT